MAQAATNEIGGSLQLGKAQDLVRELEVADTQQTRFCVGLPDGIAPPAKQRELDPVPGDNIDITRYVYRLQDTRWDVSIVDKGLSQSYGIFGHTGSGKTFLLMHLLGQLLRLESPPDARFSGRFGGLILDPKGQLVDKVLEKVKEAGRPDSDVIVIGDRQHDQLNIIDAALDPMNLGAALAMAAQAAGIKSMEPSWMIELKGLYGATLDILKAVYKETPTLESMADALLNNVVSESGVRVLKIQSILEHFLPGALERCNPDEARDLELSRNAIERFLYHDPRNQKILSQFIDSSYGLFMRSAYGKYSATLTDSQRGIYEDVIDNGKILLVSISTQDLATARILCVLVKCLFQQTVLTRFAPKLASRLVNKPRPLFFLADEYSDVATEVSEFAMGDSKFFSKSREFGCLGLVATQSIHMLEKEPYLKEAWRAIFANLSAKIFMKLGDPETAKYAIDLAGKSENRFRSWDKRYERDGDHMGWKADLREKSELPEQLLTQGFTQGEAVVIGDLTGNTKKPKVQFLFVKERPK